MYLRILKKDLKRKKTMNIILLIFIMLAAMFISSSTNNIITVSTALDSYFEKANVPDCWIATYGKKDTEDFKIFAEENNYNYKISELIQFDPNNFKASGVDFDYANSANISNLQNSTKVFDSNDNEITKINDGEIYLTAHIMNTYKGLKKGDKIELSINGKTKEFTLMGSVKDALFSSSMIGMTRMLISENDFEYFRSDDSSVIYSIYIYTDDTEFWDKLNDLGMNRIFNADYATLKTMYIMDIITAAIMIILSICLILISMVILRFTINFTMSEEFREIGVMKAIGIKNKKIRGLYIVKYLAISLAGTAAGLALSIPFGKMMIKNFSQNIIMKNKGSLFINLLCALTVMTVVMLFCYFCTRKIKKISPINAIRNGENGERYSRKNIISLGKSKLLPILYMALNDILSGLKRFSVMIVIFVLGLLLILIPLNTINTLQSDKLVKCFNMAACDHVIGQEILIDKSNENTKEIINKKLEELNDKLEENNIKADTFNEAMFRMVISFNGKKAASIAFQGVGDVTCDMYDYLKGTPPQNNTEVALTQITADQVGADIGDEIEIKDGNNTKKYVISAIYQSMNNLGEGIRFYQDEQLDYSYMAGSFGIQIKYTDSPDSDELEKRKELLKELYPDNEIYTAGEYITYMSGNVAGQLNSIKQLILIVVLCINVLVTVLMVKSFIAKEKGEIAILKAIGFKNSSLISWQTIRIGIVLLISIILGIILSVPLSNIIIGPVFKIMGAQSIEFEIVPLEVFALYPAAVLAVTVTAAMITAFQLRKISSSEVSNIE